VGTSGDTYGIRSSTHINPRDMSLLEFLEKRHKKKAGKTNDDYYSKWSKNMDYQNWKILALIGEG